MNMKRKQTTLFECFQKPVSSTSEASDETTEAVTVNETDTAEVSVSPAPPGQPCGLKLRLWSLKTDTHGGWWRMEGQKVRLCCVSWHQSGCPKGEKRVDVRGVGFLQDPVIRLNQEFFPYACLGPEWRSGSAGAPTVQLTFKHLKDILARPGTSAPLSYVCINK